MEKLNITEEELLKKYNNYTDFISEECNWITTFSGEDVCRIVHNILVDNKANINFSSEELNSLYSDYVKSLNISLEDWVKNYGIPEIINIIYDIIYKIK